MTTAKNDDVDPRSARAAIVGLYGLADADATAGDPEGLAVDLLAGGCRLIQVRCKGWPDDELLRVSRAIVTRCHAVGATCLVNDNPEVAVAAGADGVHVGQDDAPSAAVRRVVGPNRIVGRSTQDTAQIPEALVGADYVAFGPIWRTESAGRDKGVRGLDALARARALVPPTVPLVAIGGITAGRIGPLRAVGVDAWAVIGAIAHAPDRVSATRALMAASR